VKKEAEATAMRDKIDEMMKMNKEFAEKVLQARVKLAKKKQQEKETTHLRGFGYNEG
jgi:hypothetical protein